MTIDYCCPYWGSETIFPPAFIEKLRSAGFNGIEVFMGHDSARATAIAQQVQQQKATGQFVFVAQLLCPNKQLTVSEYIDVALQQLELMVPLQPDLINSQTGRDYFSFDNNCRIIDAVENYAAKAGIPLLHETHRGSFAFHTTVLIKYLEKYPHLQLTADLSHFCAVSESLLQGQDEWLAAIFPQVRHIHARIGHEQGAQVNDPFAPEWQQHLHTHLAWWQRILTAAQAKGFNRFTITPEFGPWPYMPSLPYTQMPVSNQWAINRQMMEWLQEQLQ